MPVFYLETSALMKRYKFELGSETVDELFENSTEAEILVTSHFTLLEVNAVAARLLKGGVIQLQQYHSVLGRFAQDVSDFDLIVMPLLSGMITEAIELLEEYPLRSADALHFASAVAANRASDEREFYVVSADREIVDACNGYDMSVLDPEKTETLRQLRSLRQ